MHSNETILIDSHFHTDHMSAKGVDVGELFDSLFAGSFGGGIDIGLSPGDLAERRRLLSAYPPINFAAGIYPGYAGKLAEGSSLDNILQQLEDEVAAESPAAIGEIGLDWYWEYGTRELQEQLLIAQLELANRYGLPVIIHNRDADGDIIRVLTEHPCERSGIIHCFSSGWETARALLDLGYMISFAGNITYRRNQELRDTVNKVPADRLLLETDSPYLAPVPIRGKVNTPATMQYIYSCVADVRNVDIGELCGQVHANLLDVTGNRES